MKRLASVAGLVAAVLVVAAVAGGASPASGRPHEPWLIAFTSFADGSQALRAA
jgi:hypothetical protein